MTNAAGFPPPIKALEGRLFAGTTRWGISRLGETHSQNRSSAGTAHVAVVAEPAQPGTLDDVPRRDQRAERERDRAQRGSSIHQFERSRIPAMVTRTSRAGLPSSDSSGSVLNRAMGAPIPI